LFVEVCGFELVLCNAFFAIGGCFCGAVGVDGFFGEVVGAAAGDY
jgi:hypothetical protein